MKNWKNGVHDIGPPLEHKDLRPCVTRIGFGGSAIAIIPGPRIVGAPESIVFFTDRKG